MLGHCNNIISHLSQSHQALHLFQPLKQHVVVLYVVWLGQFWIPTQVLCVCYVPLHQQNTK